MISYFDQYRPPFTDRADWSVPTVLREQARLSGDSVYLDVPWAGEIFTYAETLDQAERIGKAMLAAGP